MPLTPAEKHERKIVRFNKRLASQLHAEDEVIERGPEDRESPWADEGNPGDLFDERIEHE